MPVKQVYFSDEERVTLLAYVDSVRGAKSFSSYVKELIKKDQESAFVRVETDRLANIEKEVTRMADLLAEAVRPQFIAYPQPMQQAVVSQVPVVDEKPKLDKKQKKAMSSIMALTKKNEA